MSATPEKEAATEEKKVKKGKGKSKDKPEQKPLPLPDASARPAAKTDNSTIRSIDTHLKDYRAVRREHSRLRLPWFVNVHSFFVAPPNRANRDENGDPKTMVFPDGSRSRWSPQSAINNLRTSYEFENFAGDLSVRARNFLLLELRKRVRNEVEKGRVFLEDEKYEITMALIAACQRTSGTEFKFDDVRWGDVAVNVNNIFAEDEPEIAKGEDSERSQSPLHNQTAAMTQSAADMYVDFIMARTYTPKSWDFELGNIRNRIDNATPPLDQVMRLNFSAGSRAKRERAALVVQNSISCTPLNFDSDYLTVRDDFAKDGGAAYIGSGQPYIGGRPVMYQFAYYDVLEIALQLRIPLADAFAKVPLRQHYLRCHPKGGNKYGDIPPPQVVVVTVTEGAADAGHFYEHDVKDAKEAVDRFIARYPDVLRVPGYKHSSMIVGESEYLPTNPLPWLKVGSSIDDLTAWLHGGGK